jgi:hypothetical protein
MTVPLLIEPTLLSLARAASIAFLTLTVLVLAGPGLVTNRRTTRLFFWTAMLALMAPALPGIFLLLEKMRAKPASGFFPYYELRVWLRYAPLALVALWLVPPPMSAAALHCVRLGVRLSWWRRVRWRMVSLGAGLWLGAALVFLFAFQEFEFATTWNVRSWTVALFDAQVGGLALVDALQLAIFPVVIQLVVLAAIFFRFRSQPESPNAGHEHTPIRWLPAFWGIAVFCAPLLVLGPAAIVIAFEPGVMASLFRVAPWREIGNATGLGLAATALAWPLAGGTVARGRGWLLLLLPGLFGPLLCGLLLLAASACPGLEVMRDSVFLPVFGLILTMLPYAVLLRWGLHATADAPSLHIARFIGARRPLWKMEGWPRLAALLLLFYFAYADFTINSLLAPPQFVSVGVRLLNLLHYGFSSALVAMYLMATLAPLLAAGLTMLAAHLYARRRVR